MPKESGKEYGGHYDSESKSAPVERIVICRVDSDGRDVTDMPGLWSEDDICVTNGDVDHIKEQISRFCLRVTNGQCLGMSK